MPAPRQQRRNNARGQPGFKRIATAGAFVAVFNTWGSDHIIISFGTVAPGITLNGIPAIKRTSTGELPTFADWSGTQLNLTYAAPNLTNAETFEIPNRDPAFRGANGEYIAAGTITTPDAPPTPNGVTFNGGGSAFPGFVNVPNQDGLAVNTPGGPSTGDKFAVTVPFGFSTGCTVNGVASGSPVAAGVTTVWTWDGSAWV